MKYYTVITLFLVLGVARVSQAQQDLLQSGSIYSYYGVGIPNDYRDPDAEGMGMVGIGTFDHASTLANPAMWGLAGYTSGTGGFIVNNLNAHNNTNSQFRTIVRPTNFQVVFPVVRQHLGVSLSAYPLTNIDFNYQNTGVLDWRSTTGPNNVTYATNYLGNGGLNAIELGMGFRITNSISIGYAPSIVFGPLTDQIRTSFDSNNYNPTRYDLKVTNMGMGNRVGIFFEKAKLFTNNDGLSIGATLNMPVYLSSNQSYQSYIYTQTGVATTTTNTNSNGSMDLPVQGGAGISYWFNGHFMLGTEALYQKWSQFKDLTGTTPSYMRDRLRLSLGTQLLPKPSRTTNLFNRLAYRLGFSYDTGYLNLRGAGIKGWSVSAGLGIPAFSQFIGSTIDLDFEYGFRGTTSNDLVRERIFSVRLALNLSELMFLKKKIY